MPAMITNVKGTRYGRLTLSRMIGGGLWDCLCDCGATGIMRRPSNLRHGLKAGNEAMCDRCKSARVSQAQRERHGSREKAVVDLRANERVDCARYEACLTELAHAKVVNGQSPCPAVKCTGCARFVRQAPASQADRIRGATIRDRSSTGWVEARIYAP